MRTLNRLCSTATEVVYAYHEENMLFCCCLKFLLESSNHKQTQMSTYWARLKVHVKSFSFQKNSLTTVVPARSKIEDAWSVPSNFLIRKFICTLKRFYSLKRSFKETFCLRRFGVRKSGRNLTVVRDLLKLKVVNH